MVVSRKDLCATGKELQDCQTRPKKIDGRFLGGRQHKWYSTVEGGGSPVHPQKGLLMVDLTS